MKRIYLGIVGPIAAGKGVVTEYLSHKYGFISFSLSSIVHEELRRRGIKKFDRATLQNIGNELRAKYGNQVLAERALNILNHNGIKKMIIEGIRNPGEVKLLKKLSNFYLIAVTAKKHVRYKRLVSRKKPWDPKNWEEFLVISNRDLGLKEDKRGQQVGECIEMADHTITNNGDLKSFYKKIEKIARQLRIK